ncbi:hypothetical protein [Klebsiella michiganensis]|uniref:hypothetical protein n=1 Tax=Klebsiella michiganensis TaxID=1134687 RepID=UPI003DA0B3EC
MTSKLTREQATDSELQMLIDSHEKGTAMFLRVDAYYLMAKELQERRKAERDSEPVAYMTYKGYLLHAGDPKLAEYSEPMPLYADPRPASTPAAPVAWDYEWASYITCEGPQNFNRVIEREAPPEWAVDEGQARNIIPLYLHAQPAPVVPEGLNPETADLVLRFASALADKLYKAEQKYGRSTDWMKSDWYDDCLQSLWEHIAKGDPRDVAAYCAFMWWHGWSTKPAEGLESRTVKLPKRLSPEGYHIDEAYMVDDIEGEYLDRDEVIAALTTNGIKWEAE